SYYWVKIFGSSITGIRSLSVVISLLVFPSLYWLCRELFAHPSIALPVGVVGEVAVALIAVSPFHVLYAQEARPYSLFTVTILLSSAAFLQALRLQKIFGWLIYAITIITGLYTHLLFLLVLASQGIYLLITEQFRWTKNLKLFTQTAEISLLTFLPWIVLIIANYTAVTQRMSWSKNTTKLLFLAGNWLANISRNYLDVGLTSASPTIALKFFSIIALLIILLVAYSCYFLQRETHPKVSSFVFTLIAVTATAIVLPDLIFGGIRSTKSRYLIPSYLGIHLSISYLLATHITSTSLKKWQKQTWNIITIVLILLGIVSCTISSQADTWWNKEWGDANPRIATIISQANNPLVVSDLGYSSYGNIVYLSYLLNKRIKFQLFYKSQIIEIDKNNYSEIFFYTARSLSPGEVETKLNSKAEPICRDKRQQVWLWKLDIN
ncbi:MAG: hypothetical protein HGA42_19710, partial [Nostocales cyanobacterium W4_Combined_metabat2_030]|nr:hypothetical protein [Nostocales cyanobacterium W4_Combined_metabat2_030]